MALYDPFDPQPFPAVYVLREDVAEYRWIVHRYEPDAGWIDVVRSPMVYDSWMEANEEGAEALLNLVRLGDL